MSSALVRYSSGDRWKGLNVSEMVLPPNELRGPSSAQQHRIVVNSGRPLDVEWRSGRTGARKTYQPGDAGMHPRDHANETRWHTGSSAIIILLECNFTERLFEEAEAPLLPQRGVEDNELARIAGQLLNEVRAPGMSSAVRVDTLMLALSTQLVTKYSSRKRKLYAPKGRLSARQLTTIADYCHSDLQTDLGLNELARQVHLSPFHFSRLFTRTLGTTPYQYILKIKVEKAKYLLTHSNRSLTEIAFELGFADGAHFSNTFKKFTGIPPSSFNQP